VISGAESAGLDFVEIPLLDPETVELTAALGLFVLTGCLYTHLGTLTGCPPESGELRAVARILRSTARRAAEGGVELSIEAVNRYETYLINLASQVSDLLDEIDEPASSCTWTPTT
jgi:D-psicose/D-tagatose/L-ribulose 3-epimerase